MDETLTGKQKLFLLVKEMKIGLLNGGILVLWHLHCLASTSTCLRDTPGSEHLASLAASHLASRGNGDLKPRSTVIPMFSIR